MSDPNTDPNTWAENLSGSSVQIWREALSHLRHLSDEVWKGVKFFMAVNGFILAIMVVFLAVNIEGRWQVVFLLLLALLGLGNSVVGRYVLKRNRVYYLEMLLKKTLLEDELGFYEMKFSGAKSDLAFPWRLKPEAVAELKEKPEEWVQRQIRGPGTIARWLFVMFETSIVIFSLALAGLVIAWLQ